jgi:hypothetical protein
MRSSCIVILGPVASCLARQRNRTRCRRRILAPSSLRSRPLTRRLRRWPTAIPGRRASVEPGIHFATFHLATWTRAVRTSCLQSDPAVLSGSFQMRSSTKESARPDPETIAEGTGNHHCRKATCSIQGRIDSAAAIQEEEQPAHSERCLRSIRQQESVARPQAHDTCARVYRAPFLVAVRTGSPQETGTSTRSPSYRRTPALRHRAQHACRTNHVCESVQRNSVHPCRAEQG